VTRAERILRASLIALLSCACDSEPETALAPKASLSAPPGSVGSESKPALAIQPAAWTNDVESRPRCGIANPADGSVLPQSAWQKTSVKVITPGWRGRKQDDLIRVALDDFPAVTLSREDTTVRLSDVSHGELSLKEGLHTVFAYPVGKNGRHPKGAMVGVTRFWIGTPTHKLPLLQSARYVRLSSPTGSWTVSRGEPTLLDVVLFGTNLADDGLKLRVSLRGPGGETSLVASQWTPLSLSGLGTGKYQLAATLITAQGHSGVAHNVELMVR
jgi:hypothetical protein